MNRLREMSTSELLHFTGQLSTRDWRKLTERDFAEIGVFIATDGCSGVPDFYLNWCIIHDWWYRTHRNLDGTPITKDQADKGIAEGIRSQSWLGRFSPMAWWRQRGLQKWFKKSSKKAWD
mgnify:CR=1 FL=1